MKYIRTEDGVYEDAGTDALGLRCVRYKGNVIALSQDDDKIVKEADTIGKLCDAYFAVSNTDHKSPIKIDFRNKIIYQWQAGFLMIASYSFKHFLATHDVYGCICTERGLIYVAKMNGKGELELL